MTYAESPIRDAPMNRMSSSQAEGESAAFRVAMREFANGVAVITTAVGDERAGCTATSVCSLSLDPPCMLVCIARTSSTLAMLRSAGVFGVNILAGLHENLAERFAGRGGTRGAGRFAGAEWFALQTGAPLLRDALTCIDCAVEEILDRHTHAVVIGRVAAVRRGGGATALIHWRGRFEGLD